MAETHLIFDLDDTLYAERDFALGGFRAAVTWARSTLGVQIDVDRMLGLLDDGQLGRLFQTALSEAKPDHTSDDLKAFVRAYGRQTPDIRLFEDAAEALAHWRSRTRFGLITDGHPATQHAKIWALALAPKFDHIIITGALGPDRQFHKPHPRSFEQMQAALGQPGDLFVYVGDNLSKDFVAPNALGWTSILVDRPAHRAQRIHKNTTAPSGGEPHAVVGDLGELQRVLA